MREYIQKTKDYYDGLKAKYGAWMSLVKLIALIAGLTFSGWTAIDKINTPDLTDIKENIKSKVEDVKKEVRSVRKAKSTKVVKEAISVQAPPVHRSLSRRMFGASGWLLVIFILGYLLLKHSWEHYKKWTKKDGAHINNPPKVL